MCDTVTIYFETLGVSSTAKCVAAEYDVLHERYNSIGIGYVKESYPRIVANHQRKISSTASKRDVQRTSASISASTKAELSGYATQAYVTQQIQVAVVSTWEASY